MRVTLNTTSGRVESLFVKLGEEDVPVEMDKEYQMITLDFLTRGGNGYNVSWKSSLILHLKH